MGAFGFKVLKPSEFARAIRTLHLTKGQFWG
jgi:hypothetical protein